MKNIKAVILSNEIPSDQASSPGGTDLIAKFSLKECNPLYNYVESLYNSHIVLGATPFLFQLFIKRRRQACHLLKLG